MTRPLRSILFLALGALAFAAGPLALAGPAAPLASTVRALLEAEEVSLLKLTTIDYKRGKPLPEDIQALDEKLVRIEGYMALGTEEGQEGFMMVTDSCGCAGQGNPHHFVDVTLTDEVTQYTPELVTVVGTLSVGERIEDGFVVSVYRLKTTEPIE